MDAQLDARLKALMEEGSGEMLKPGDHVGDGEMDAENDGDGDGLGGTAQQTHSRLSCQEQDT